MALRAAVIKEYEDNFVLDEVKLRKIASIMGEYAAKLGEGYYVEFYVEREDQVSYETKDVEEVLGDENAEGKRIVTISMSIEPPPSAGEKPDSKTQKQKTKAFVGFTKQKSPRVRFGLANESRDWCFLLSDELDGQIKRLSRKRPLKFVPLRYFDAVVLFAFLGALLTWTFLWLRGRPPIFTPDQIGQMSQDQKLTELLKLSIKGVSQHDWIYPIAMLFTSLCLTIVGFRPLARLIEYLYESTFQWGDAVSHFDRKEKLASNIRWGVVIAFVISVIAGLATTGLLNFWTKH